MFKKLTLCQFVPVSPPLNCEQLVGVLENQMSKQVRRLNLFYPVRTEGFLLISIDELTVQLVEQMYSRIHLNKISFSNKT